MAPKNRTMDHVNREVARINRTTPRTESDHKSQGIDVDRVKVARQSSDGIDHQENRPGGPATGKLGN